MKLYEDIPMIDKELSEIICNRIKDLRKSNKITMEGLAYQSGISKGGLSEIERGMKEPRVLTILKICSALRIPLSDFFNFDELNEFAKKL